MKANQRTPARSAGFSEVRAQAAEFIRSVDVAITGTDPADFHAYEDQGFFRIYRSSCPFWIAAQ